MRAAMPPCLAWIAIIVWACVGSVSDGAYAQTDPRVSNASGNSAEKTIPIELSQQVGHSISDLVVSQDDNFIVSSDQSGTRKVWRVGTPGASSALIRTIYCEASIWDMALSADGRTAASAHDGNIKLWDVETGRLTTSIALGQAGQPTTRVRSTAFFRDGRSLISASADGAVKIWDTTTGNIRKTILPNGNPVLKVALSADDSFAVTGDDIVHIAGLLGIGHGGFKFCKLCSYGADWAGAVHNFGNGTAARHVSDILAEVANRNAAVGRDLTLVGLLLAGDQAEQRGLASTIGTDEANFLAPVKRGRGLDKEDLVAILLSDVVETNHGLTGGRNFSRALKRFGGRRPIRLYCLGVRGSFHPTLCGVTRS